MRSFEINTGAGKIGHLAHKIIQPVFFTAFHQKFSVLTHQNEPIVFYELEFMLVLFYWNKKSK